MTDVCYYRLHLQSIRKNSVVLFGNKTLHIQDTALQCCSSYGQWYNISKDSFNVTTTTDGKIFLELNELDSNSNYSFRLLVSNRNDELFQFAYNYLDLGKILVLHWTTL